MPRHVEWLVVRLLAHRTRERRQIIHVEFHELELWIFQRTNKVRAAAELHIVHAQHERTAFKKTVNEMAADEARRAGDQTFLAHFRGRDESGWRGVYRCRFGLNKFSRIQ